MDFAFISDPALNAVALVAATLFLVSVLCLAGALVLRFFRLRREQRSTLLEAKWRPLCFAAMVNDLPAFLPELSPGDARLFTEIWLDCLDRVRGTGATSGLILLARKLRLHQFLIPLLRSSRTDKRLLALLALGTLQDSRALPLAERSLDDPYPLLSLAAARALMEIDAHTAVPLLLDRLDTPGWPLGRLRQLLQPASAKLLRQELTHRLAHAGIERIPTLLSMFHQLAESDFEQAATEVLRRFPESPGIISQVLLLTSDPSARPLVLFGIHHSLSSVRQAALSALGRIGSLDDQALLIERLQQDDWANQQNAARALITLPGMDPERAHAILSRLTTTDSRLHWQEALYNHGWLPAGLPIERPLYA